MGYSPAEVWLGGVYVCEGGEETPISNPKRRLIGTSENLLKGVIPLSIISHWSGIKGVLIISKSGDNVALLGGMNEGTA